MQRGRGSECGYKMSKSEKVLCWIYGITLLGMYLYIVVAWILKTYFGIEGL